MTLQYIGTVNHVSAQTNQRPHPSSSSEDLNPLVFQSGPHMLWLLSAIVKEEAQRKETVTARPETAPELLARYSESIRDRVSPIQALDLGVSTGDEKRTFL